MANDVPTRVWLAAGAAGWRRGHDDVRDGRLNADQIAREAMEDAEPSPTHAESLLTAEAADAARDYSSRAVSQFALTPAQGVRLTLIYMHAYIRGALDEALDAGALDQRREGPRPSA